LQKKFSMEQHKSGFVNIIGNPNTGKSTLMNAFVGEKISIITSKAQTTRHRIKGIVNGDDFQIVFSDTPGVLKPHYELQKSMLAFSESALSDADVIVYVTDVFETFDKNSEFLEKVKKANIPTLLILNKIDKSDQERLEKLVAEWRERLPEAEIYPASALEKFNVDIIFKRILALLPESPPYFPKDQFTDRSERFFVTEIIREKILLNYQKEVPYSVEVEVEEFKEEADIIRIRAIIHVNSPSQKGIIIGHKGLMLKRIGTDARKDIEAFFDKHVFIEIYVKITKDWRDSKDKLRRFGYDE